MINKKQLLIFTVSLFCTVFSFSQSTDVDTINWSDPLSLNPLDPATGNFLDVNFNYYKILADAAFM